MEGEGLEVYRQGGYIIYEGGKSENNSKGEQGKGGCRVRSWMLMNKGVELHQA